jgi:phenylalanyl-tRNA synthetase alpha chain
LERQIGAVKEAALKACRRAQTSTELEAIRVKYLGKKGEVTQLLRGMGKVPPEERPRLGKLVNEARDKLERALQEAGGKLASLEEQRRLEGERVDITLPGRRPPLGHKHPLTLVLDEIKHVFRGMGFDVVQGPEVETDYYNFEALNVPKYHPARDMQDTFYITDDILLRTQTSPVQVRVMERRKPPIRIIAPGKVYRCDADVTHSPMFHQVEGLAVDKHITFGDLKGVLKVFAEELFGKDTGVRFRPSYFPFTEPSAEIDISCVMCHGKGCRVCSHSGWLEILGAGMVHPRVLEMVGYDSEEVGGFAFGMGVERIAMLKYGVDDIRLFFENDARFLAQF